MSKPKKGERKEQILQSLAHMLENSPGQRITTANLAKEVGVSEAALYRHFPSKSKMFEGLIEFIEETVFSRIGRIVAEEKSAQAQCEKILFLVLNFSEKNPGITRLLTGDALAGERERLRQRIVQFFERITLQLKQILREAELKENMRTAVPAAVCAATLMSVLEGRLGQYVRTEFRQLPTENWNEVWIILQQGIFTPPISAFTRQ